MGRLEGLSMAAAGRAGLVKALKLVETELRLSMALLGVADIADLDGELVHRSEALGQPNVLSAFPLLETL
jgi:isopentenyl diphosphate isomerase/L-lactate dehydrogenase-like FMN-dependent dehydrogenase